MDAPEIDGVVRFGGAGRLPIGGFVNVRITGSDAHDLEGEMVDERDAPRSARARVAPARGKGSVATGNAVITHDERMDR
jgi:hypothetical protein